MFLKFLSPVSIAVGVLAGVLVVASLWPVDGYGPPLALMGFCIGAGGCELVRRIRRPAAADADAGEAASDPNAGRTE